MQRLRNGRRFDFGTPDACCILACALLVTMGGGCGATADTGNGESDSTVVSLEQQQQARPASEARACLFCPRTLTTGGTPTGIAVTTTTLFWTGILGTGVDARIGIFSVPTTGGSSTLLYSPFAPGTLGGTPDSLVAAGGALFWQQPLNSGGTWTMPQSGGPPTKLTSISQLGPQRQGVAARSTAPATIRHFWSTTVLSSDPSNSHLWEFGISTLSPAWATTTLVSNLDTGSGHLYYPDSVTMDGLNAYFVTDRFSSPQSVYQISLSGGTPLLIGYADLASPIAVYGSYVYFVSGNSIVTVPVGGGSQSTFATDQGPPTTFAVDGGTLYWTCTSCGTVSKRAFSGGSVSRLASGEQSPEYLAVDSAYVYWGATNAVRFQFK